MKNDGHITQDELKKLLHYNPRTGVFIWLKTANNNGARCGDVAGTLFRQGHIAIGVRGTQLYAQRLAWLYMTGEWPEDEIDHANGDKADNRWENLRIATSAQQKYNTKKPVNNTSGIKGVHRNKKGWQGRIRVPGGYIHKTFPTIEEAAEYVRAMRELHHGEFANHG